MTRCIRLLVLEAWLALAALCTSLPAGAQAVDYPPRKPGLWEMRVEAQGRAGGKEEVIQQCTDEATDAMLREWTEHRGEGRCTRYPPRRAGDGIVVDSVCRIGRTTATIRAEMSGDLASDYRLETRTSFRPPLRGRAQGHAVMQARWTGPCEAGQMPGDIILPGGRTLNLLDKAGGSRPPGPPGPPGTPPR